MTPRTAPIALLLLALVCIVRWAQCQEADIGATIRACGDSSCTDSDVVSEQPTPEAQVVEQAAAPAVAEAVAAASSALEENVVISVPLSAAEPMVENSVKGAVEALATPSSAANVSATQVEESTEHFVWPSAPVIDAKPQLHVLLFPGLVLVNNLDMYKIGATLVAGGHAVKALVPDHAQTVATANLSCITYASVQLQQYDFYGTPLQDLTTRLSFELSNCASVLSNRTLVQLLGDQKFDMLLGDSTDACVQLVSHKLGIPYSVYDSGGSFSLSHGVLQRNAYPLASVAAYGSRLPGGVGGALMPFRARMRNILQHMRLKWWYHRTYQPRVAAFRKRFRVPTPTRRACSSCGGPALTLVAADWGFIEPHNVAPTVKMVGPILAGRNEPTGAQLSEEVLKFLGGATHGVVVISLPQHLRLTLRAQMAIAEAILDLKQRVLWELSESEHHKVRTTYLPLQHASSILVQTHLPIDKLLAHPKVVSIVTDGSVQAVYMALYHAKPMACVPLTIEQDDIVSRVVGLGIGRRLYRDDLESGAASYRVSIAIERLSNVYAFTEHVQALSRQLRAMGGSAAERAAAWLVYGAVATGAGAGSKVGCTLPLTPATACSGALSARNADVWAAWLAGTAALVALAAYVFHICTRMPPPKPPTKAKKE